MKLSKRLQAIADLIIKYKHGHILGDIGTDHAYLPCYLVSQHDFSKRSEERRVGKECTS